VALVNQERASRGLHALEVSAELASVARRHSGRMAQQQRLHHNPSLSSEVSYRKVGENVGYGETVDQVHRAFMASSGHRGNVLSPDYTQIGVGVAWRDGTLWVTEVFRLPKGASPPPAPAPPPPPRKAPSAPRAAPPAPPPAPEPEPEAEPVSRHLRLVFARVVAQDSRVEVGTLVGDALKTPSP